MKTNIPLPLPANLTMGPGPGEPVKFPAYTKEDKEQVETVYLIFKTHLDLGFTDFAWKVKQTYFNSFLPRALELARDLRESGASESFVWTTGSWIIYEYLEHASIKERQELEKAIRLGDIAWHALPFTLHSELMDPGLFEFGLSIAKDLDRRFGRQTTSAKMTDVPGHTRGIVPLLARAGVNFLHIGVNAASTAPSVPPLFVWRDPASQSEIIVMYQAGSYGDLTVLPEQKVAICFEHTNDNLGPPSKAEFLANFQKRRQQFPNARIIAARLDDFAKHLLPIQAQLPVITAEIGDSWIHGGGTDPLKLSQFRDLSRWRAEWLSAHPGLAEDKGFCNFSLALLQVPEHTWGLDEKTFLADYTTYTNAQLAQARQQTNFKTFEASWQEQRAYLDQALQALETTQPDLAGATRQRLKQNLAASPEKTGYSEVIEPGAKRKFETTHFELSFNPENGALNFLRQKSNGRKWASPKTLVGLIGFEVFDQADYNRFWEQYAINKAETAGWAYYDLTKPGLEGVVKGHQWYFPRLAGISSGQDAAGHRFLLEFEPTPQSFIDYGCPKDFSLEITLPHTEPALQFNLQWFHKPASRLPQALWFSFAPIIRDKTGWFLDKLGTEISPLGVVANGNRKLHGIYQNVYYREQSPVNLLKLTSLDAALVAPGRPSLLDFNNDQPDLKEGLHFNLYNNVWGTNFPMWYEEDARFRFKLQFG